MPNLLLAEDLDYIFESINPLWDQLRNKNIFMTGGTGFFGCWFLESFIEASKKLNLNATMTVLTRNPVNFKKKYLELCSSSFIDFHEGDVRDFSFPDKKCSHFIHAATDISAFHSKDYLNGLETIIKGTSRTLEFAKYCHAENFLFISSGAIYGKQPSELTYLLEEQTPILKIDELTSTYGIGKYTAEHLCHLYHHFYQLNAKIARCFTFIGPYIPLEGHFAISSFLKSVLEKTPIIIQSPNPLYRSYLYAADLMVWLWKILFCGKPSRPYNVGSNQVISILELANLVAKNSSPNLQVIQKHLWSTDIPAQYYIPDISRAQNELNLFQRTSLLQSINSTLNWYSV